MRPQMTIYSLFTIWNPRNIEKRHNLLNLGVRMLLQNVSILVVSIAFLPVVVEALYQWPLLAEFQMIFYMKHQIFHLQVHQCHVCTCLLNFLFVSSFVPGWKDRWNMTHLLFNNCIVNLIPTFFFQYLLCTCFSLLYYNR